MITQQQLEAKIRQLFPIEFKPKVEPLKGHPCDLKLDELTDDQIFALTAWEFWKDGQDWNSGIPQIALGQDAVLKTRELCIQALKNIFSY